MIPNIDKIYVVNLEWRLERWKSFEESMHNWERAFDRTPERFQAVAGINLKNYGERPWFTSRISKSRMKAWGGKAGCILSHTKIIQQAADQQLQGVFIVEDDADLTSDMADLWSGCLKKTIVDLPDDWSVIYFFATNPVSPCRIIADTGKGKLVEACGAFSTVAYLLNGQIFNQLLNELPDLSNIWQWVARYKTIDRWYSQNLVRFGRVYLFAPSVVGHHCVGSSDISMTADQDWKLDFTHENICFVHGDVSFKVLKLLRMIENFMRRQLTVFRLVVKRVRGL